MNYERRQQATAHYAQATAAINATFDAHDHLRTIIDAIRAATEVPDLLAAVTELGTLQHCLDDGLAVLRAAAANAVTYRSKAEIARDLDTKTVNLFPRDNTATGVMSTRVELVGGVVSATGR